MAGIVKRLVRQGSTVSAIITKKVCQTRRVIKQEIAIEKGMKISSFTYLEKNFERIKRKTSHR